MSKPYQEDKDDWLEAIQDEMRVKGMFDDSNNVLDQKLPLETDLATFFKSLEALKKLYPDFKLS